MSDVTQSPPLTAGPLLLCTLGEVGLRAPGAAPEATPLLGAGKPLALIAYLAFSPGRRASREHLTDLLWSDLEPERAKHALRQTVYFLRNQLGDTLLASRGGELALTSDLETDREAFVAAVEAGELERAVSLYSGSFLPGFASPGGAEFEQWADLERSRLRAVFIRAAEAQTRRLLDISAAREAQKLARRVRDEDPLDESGWRLLIETLLAGNDRLTANIEADSLTALLKSEGRDPEPATRAVLRLVRQRPESGEPVAPGGGGLFAELVGREREFAAVIAAWDQARAGQARHLHAVAPAGLGKTRLLNDIHGRLRAAGGTVVHLRANPGDRRLSYALAGELARALGILPGAAGISPAAAGALMALHPGLSSHFSVQVDLTTGDEALRRRTMALAETLAVVADETPVALLLDDVHWADPLSQQLLLGVLDRLQAGVLVVSTARPSRDGTIEVARTQRLALDPLTVPQIGALLASLGVVPRDDWTRSLVAALHTTSGGSPLLVLETLQLALDRGSLVLGPAGWECPDPIFLITELQAGGALRHRITQLDDSARSLLILLGTAGTPLPLAQVAAAAQRAPEDVESELSGLERRGFTGRNAANEWEVAHDQIAEIAIETSPPELVRSVNGALGRVFATASETAPELMPRAAHHLIAGGLEVELRLLYNRWVGFAARRGDYRPSGALAQELLGDHASSERVALLRKSQPLYRRVLRSPTQRTTFAAVVVLAVVVAATALFRRPAPVPAEATLMALWGGPGDSAMVASVPIRRAALDADTPMELSVTPSAWTFPLWSHLLGTPEPQPGGNSWAFGLSTSDPGIIDLFLLHPGAEPERITTSNRDDSDPAWSPDGERIVFSTTRWSSNATGQASLAVIRPGQDTVHRLTTAPAYDYTPQWSPDGTRIGFARRHLDFEPTEFCWVTTDGGSGDCRRPVGFEVVSLLRWTDPHHVLIVADSVDRQVVLRLGVEDGETRVVDPGPVNQAVASPDGQWIAALEQRPNERTSAWHIYPVDDPDRVQRVVLQGTRNGALFWGAHSSEPAYLASLQIVRPTASISVEAPYRLSAVGADSGGRPFAPPAATLRWRSTDTSIAVVDSLTGLLRPRRTGSLRLIASAGGWRRDTATVTIASTGSRQALDERWAAPLKGRWVMFGDPSPRVVIGPDSTTAFWNAGDGSFTSGAYSTTMFDGTHGVGVEAKLSAPVTRPQWQLLRMSLTAALDSATVAAWDTRNGVIPGSPYDSRQACRLDYPGGEGGSALERFVIEAGGSSHRVPAPASVVSADWFDVVLQIFPDGTCGVAVNGEPVWQSSAPIPLSRKFRVVVQGNSVDTRMLVGPLRVWTGIRSDIPWNRMP